MKMFFMRLNVGTKYEKKGLFFGLNLILTNVSLLKC